MNAQSTPLPTKYLTLTQAAAYLSISPATLRRRIAEGTVPYRRTSRKRGHFRFLVSELDRYVDRLPGVKIGEVRR